MGAVGARIPHCQNNIARHLVLDIQVVLLNHALLEIEILSNDRPLESVNRWRRQDGCKGGCQEHTLNTAVDRRVAGMDKAAQLLKLADSARYGGFCHNPWAP